MYSSGRCEEFFEDPLAFKPERFMNTDSEIANKFLFFYFIPLKIN